MTEEVLKKAEQWSGEDFDEKTRREIRDLIEKNDEKIKRESISSK